MKLMVFLHVLCEDFATRPDLAEIRIDSAELEHLKERASQAKRLNLAEVREDRGPDAWHGMAMVRTSVSRMCMTQEGTFYFECRELHSGVVFETTRVALADIEQALRGVETKGIRWFGPDEASRSLAFDTVNCRLVEFDLAFGAGDYSGVGNVFIPTSLVDECEGSIEKAFTSLTGHDAIHIVRVTSDTKYSLSGRILEE